MVLVRNVVSPYRSFRKKGRKAVRPTHGGAGMGVGKSECRPVMGRIRVALQHHPTRKRADFPAVSRHENHGGIDTEGVANDGGLVPLVLPSPQGHRRLSSIVQPAGGMTADGSFIGPLRGLSWMKGNCAPRDAMLNP